AFVHGPRPCKYGALARQATVRADNGHGPGPKLSRGARHQRVNGHRPAIAGAAPPPLRQINSDSGLTATHTLRYKGQGGGCQRADISYAASPPPQPSPIKGEGSLRKGAGEKRKASAGRADLASQVAGDAAHRLLQQEDLRARHHVGDVEVEARRLALLHTPLGEVDPAIGSAHPRRRVEAMRFHRAGPGPALGEREPVTIRARHAGGGTQLEPVLAPGGAGVVDGDLGDGEADDMLAADTVAE